MASASRMEFLQLIKLTLDQRRASPKTKIAGTKG
jgi:hypothetical protein